MQNETRNKVQGTAPVNGLSMYFEIEGAGDPLIYVPPAFGIAGFKSFPALTETHRVISVDLQGNGRTADISDRPLSIQHYADDVVGLLRHLGIAKADFFGESYGGSAVALIALQKPELVRRAVTFGATFGPLQNALDPVISHFDYTPTAETKHIAFQRELYKKVAVDPGYWSRIYDKVSAIKWEGFSKEELASIQVPMLIVGADGDFVRPEHAIEAARLIPHAEVAVIPSASHFALFSEPDRVIPIVKHFLEKPERPIPLATAGSGYHPGETR